MLAPILAGYAIMARYAVNMPLIDDYPTILGFCLNYERLPSAGARLHYILADQYLEYKLVMIHLISAVELALTHHVSFALLFWVGNLMLLPLLYILWRCYIPRQTHPGRQVDPRRRLVIFVPIVFLLFSLNYGEALDWTSTSLGYIGTLTLSLGAIELLASSAKDRAGVKHGTAWRYAAACLCALAACLISANAVLLLPLGLVLLLPRRAYGWAAAWCAVVLASLIPYLFGFARETRFGHGSALLIPVFFFSFLGGALQFIPLAVPLGLTIVCLYVLALRSGFFRTHPAAMLSVTWLLASAALAAVGRGRTGLAFSVVSRYRIYSDLLLIFCYGFLADWVQRQNIPAHWRRRLYGVALAAAVLLWAHGDYQAANILKGRRAMMLAAAAGYRADPQRNSPMHFGDRAADEFFAAREIEAREEVTAAEREGLYRLPVEAAK